ncbi:MAG TPA: glycosyltransferase, partial [Chloroflexota bacterium]|nr:glycosyltransferase [Chloroflexota bacterium]
DELAEHLALVDVAVSAKVSATEGNGKLLNYMAAGLPAVAYETDVARDILGPLGAYAPPGDIAALGQAIEALLNDPARRAQLGAALRARAESELSWDAAGRKLARLYDELVSARSAVRLPESVRARSN